MPDARQPIQGMPWNTVALAFRSWSLDRFIGQCQGPFLVVEALATSGSGARFDRPPGSSGRTILIDPEMVLGPKLGLSSAATRVGSASDRRVYELVPTQGSRGPRRVIVGRSPPSDIVLWNPAISRTHALIQHDAEGIGHIVDLGSTNGTTVNGRRLPSEEPCALREGCLIHFADAYSAIYHSPSGLFRLLSADAA